jgi:hypothetical protein
MMLVVYIAGPFRGANGWEIEENVRRAERLSLKVWAAGAVALCPHNNTRFFQGTLPDSVFIEGTKEMLRRSDVVLFTWNWKLSEGARDEYVDAVALKKRVFYSDKTTESVPQALIELIRERERMH